MKRRDTKQGAHVTRVLHTGNEEVRIELEFVCTSFANFLKASVDEFKVGGVAYVAMGASVFPTELVSTMFLTWPNVCRIIVTRDRVGNERRYLGTCSSRGTRFLASCDLSVLNTRR